MKIVCQIAIIAITVIHLTSCNKNKCNGVDKRIYNYGMDIENEGDTLTAINKQYSDEIRLMTLSRSEEGSRDCIQKDLVFSFGELIDTTTLAVYCNNEIISKKVTVPAGTNMRNIPELSDKLSGHIVLLMDSVDVAGKTYTYYVKGSTDKGNKFIDSTVVYYQN